MERRKFIGVLAATATNAMIFSEKALAQGLNAICGPPFRIPADPAPVQNCRAGIPSALLNVTARDRQHASEWCWAACISGVFAYHGHPVSQERIVEETWGGIVNLPGQPEQILEDLNREWTDDRGDNFQSLGDIVTANPVTAAQDLSIGQPLILGALGHATILTAVSYIRDFYGRGEITEAIVRDPWPYRPARRPLSPIEWANISFAVRIRVTSS